MSSKREEYRSNRRVAVMYFLVRQQRAKKAGDLRKERELNEILQEIQRVCPHTDIRVFVARTSGVVIRAGQPFSLCTECNKLMYEKKEWRQDVQQA